MLYYIGLLFNPVSEGCKTDIEKIVSDHFYVIFSVDNCHLQIFVWMEKKISRLHFCHFVSSFFQFLSFLVFQLVFPFAFLISIKCVIHHCQSYQFSYFLFRFYKFLRFWLQHEYLISISANGRTGAWGSCLEDYFSCNYFLQFLQFRLFFPSISIPPSFHFCLSCLPSLTMQSIFAYDLRNLSQLWFTHSSTSTKSLRKVNWGVAWVLKLEQYTCRNLKVYFVLFFMVFAWNLGRIFSHSWLVFL